MNTEQHMLYALRNAPLKKWPFPHFYAENVFPDDVYREILRNLHKKSDYEEREYKNRTFALDSTLPGLEFMLSPAFLQNMLAIFNEQAKPLAENEKLQVMRDVRLIRDRQQYKIGPHTDAKWKLVSLLFYLPADNWHQQYGTSIFIPKAPRFTCEGGPHYPFEDFHKVYTAPFAPNTCFGFWKTNRSFHGVEPIPVQFNRDILLFNIYKQQSPKPSQPSQPSQESTP